MPPLPAVLMPPLPAVLTPPLEAVPAAPPLATLPPLPSLPAVAVPALELLPALLLLPAVLLDPALGLPLPAPPLAAPGPSVLEHASNNPTVAIAKLEPCLRTLKPMVKA
jgi:hypothetical protein